MPISVPSTHLSLVIDPAGINLRVFPIGDKPLAFKLPESNNNRTANGLLIAGGRREYHDFECSFNLDADDFNSLRGLWSRLLERRRKGLPFECVIYNLAEPYSELAPNKTRRRVPGTTDLQVGNLSSNVPWIYWIAVQGVFDLEWRLVGDLATVEFAFTEGTFLEFVPDPPSP